MPLKLCIQHRVFKYSQITQMMSLPFLVPHASVCENVEKVDISETMKAFFILPKV